MTHSLLLSVVLLCAASLGTALQRSLVLQRSDQTVVQTTREPELLAEGRQALVKGEYEKALGALKQVAESEPNEGYRTQARYYLGRAYYFLKRNDEALNTYRQLVAENPGVVMAYYEMGKIFIEQQDFAQAAQEYVQLKNISQTLQSQAKLSAAALANNPAKPPVIETDSVLLASTATKAQQLADELAFYLADLFLPDEAARYQIPLAPPIPPAQPKLLKPAEGANSDQAQNAVSPMGKDGVGRPTITYKEKARYTEPARLNMVQGVVVLSVIFSVDGEVQGIRVVRSLPDGLTRKAIEAALKIRFQPATKDGAPVSVRGNLEYSFNLF